jgi:hypothetical protein
VSHWAEIDETGLVLRVLVGDNNEPDEGKSFMESLGGTWIQTSYNNNIRYNYAGIGMTYDAARDAFISPKCHDEATLDEATCRWVCANQIHTSTDSN